MSFSLLVHIFVTNAWATDLAVSTDHFCPWGGAEGASETDISIQYLIMCDNLPVFLLNQRIEWPHV